jgi:hypothetical protein
VVISIALEHDVEKHRLYSDKQFSALADIVVLTKISSLSNEADCRSKLSFVFVYQGKMYLSFILTHVCAIFCLLVQCENAGMQSGGSADYALNTNDALGMLREDRSISAII